MTECFEKKIERFYSFWHLLVTDSIPYRAPKFHGLFAYRGDGNNFELLLVTTFLFLAVKKKLRNIFGREF